MSLNFDYDVKIKTFYEITKCFMSYFHKEELEDRVIVLQWKSNCTRARFLCVQFDFGFLKEGGDSPTHLGWA